MICIGHGPVHGSANDTEVVLLVPRGDSGLNMFLTSVTSHHQFPGSLRAELPCTDFSYLYSEAAVPAKGTPRQSGFFLPSHF